MRKIYTSIVILVAASMGLMGCHSGSPGNNSSVFTYTPPQKTIDYVNGNIKAYDEIFLPFSERIVKSGLEAEKIFHDLGTQIDKKYGFATQKGWFDPFAHSSYKEQMLLFMELQNIFIDGNTYPRYTLLGKTSDIVSDFQQEWEPFFMLHKNEGYFIYDPHRGQTVKVILERLQPLMTDTDHLRGALVRLLNFDYTKFEAQWHPLISRFWKAVYETNTHAASFRGILLNMHKDMNMLKCERIWIC